MEPDRVRVHPMDDKIKFFLNQAIRLLKLRVFLELQLCIESKLGRIYNFVPKWGKYSVDKIEQIKPISYSAPTLNIEFKRLKITFILSSIVW